MYIVSLVHNQKEKFGFNLNILILLTLIASDSKKISLGFLHFFFGTSKKQHLALTLQLHSSEGMLLQDLVQEDEGN